MAKALIEAGKLTKYQAAAIYQGKAQGLLFLATRVADTLAGNVPVGLLVDRLNRNQHSAKVVAETFSSYPFKECVARFPGAQTGG